MRRLETPKINAQASTEEKLEEVIAYLGRLVEALNSDNRIDTALDIFKAAYSSLREAGIYESGNTAGKELGSFAVALVSEVFSNKSNFFVEKNGELAQTGLVAVPGGYIGTGELFEKVKSLENEIRKLKGDQ